MSSGEGSSDTHRLSILSPPPTNIQTTNQHILISNLTLQALLKGNTELNEGNEAFTSCPQGKKIELSGSTVGPTVVPPLIKKIKRTKDNGQVGMKLQSVAKEMEGLHILTQIIPPHQQATQFTTLSNTIYRKFNKNFDISRRRQMEMILFWRLLHS